DLPFAMKLSRLLKAEGVALNGQNMTEEELVNDIWTSNFNA
ncbi:MAG TPA: energy-coupling factor ABC transporter ATP-binding protein, partial [Metalysinibacillus sp.]